MNVTNCNLCPRFCGKHGAPPYCGTRTPIVAKIMLHRFEEPLISGQRGSGAIFFSGCNLRCVYCQNHDISAHLCGQAYSAEELARAMLDLQDRGAHNINLVTAAHFLPQVINALRQAKPRLTVPVVYNTSSYESTAAIKALDGLVDVYLPDYKYFDGNLALKYSAAPDYPQVARAAIAEMLRQTGSPTISNGLLHRGVIIRHLVLPGCYHDSINVLGDIAERFPSALLSLMSQYTPQFNRSDYPELNRKITSYEYRQVLDCAVRLGLNGFCQQRSSASVEFTPDFTSKE